MLSEKYKNSFFRNLDLLQFCFPLAIWLRLQFTTLCCALKYPKEIAPSKKHLLVSNKNKDLLEICLFLSRNY